MRTAHEADPVSMNVRQRAEISERSISVADAPRWAHFSPGGRRISAYALGVPARCKAIGYEHDITLRQKFSRPASRSAA
jgi:hypothetical protein